MPERYQGPVGAPLHNPSFDEWPEHSRKPQSRGRFSGRGVIALLLSVACSALVAIPLSLILGSVKPSTNSSAKLGSGPAQHRVLSALSATINSDSYDMTYSEQPPTAPLAGGPVTTCPPPSFGKTECVYSGPQGLTISGQGTINTNPFAMVASSNVPGLGLVTARVDGTHVWEIGGGNYGLSPDSSSTGPGSSLSGFASLVEGTLGPRQGALAMMGLASPTGYLELDEKAITSASQIGSGVVDGAAVTVFQVTLSPAQQASVPGATPEETTAIGDALAVLKEQGYTGTTVKVSIDAAGYIRQTVSVASFSDGVTQTSEATLSNFGCAGKVLMPGQSGPTSPPQGCTSPDAALSTR